jgi:hypothetical protein
MDHASRRIFGLGAPSLTMTVVNILLPTPDASDRLPSDF